MRTLHTIDPMLGPPRTQPPLRLAFSRVMTRVFVGTFVILETFILLTIFVQFRGFPAFVKIRQLFWVSFLNLFWCALLASILALIGTLFVRLILRPLMARWYDPRPADASIGGHAPFQLAASEWVVAELPARRRGKGLGEAGHVVLTNQRVWFFPSAWDSEPWNARLDRLEHVRLEPSALTGIRSVRGWPDEIVFRDESGHEARIVVVNPAPVLDWFEETDIPCYLHRS